MEIRVRRVRRTWPERLLWSRAYEARVLCDGQEIIKRAKTSEDAKALIVNAVQQMTDFGIQIEVRGDLLIVTQPTLFSSVVSPVY